MLPFEIKEPVAVDDSFLSGSNARIIKFIGIRLRDFQLRVYIKEAQLPFAVRRHCLEELSPGMSQTAYEDNILKLEIPLVSV